MELILEQIQLFYSDINYTVLFLLYVFGFSALCAILLFVFSTFVIHPLVHKDIVAFIKLCLAFMFMTLLCILAGYLSSDVFAELVSGYVVHIF